jgi:PAS domain S-box-containing protein
MNRSAAAHSRWGGDSNAEWMNLAVESAGIGVLEFDLEQGTGFFSEEAIEILGYSKNSRPPLVQYEDWLSMMRPEDRRHLYQACDPSGNGELKMRLELIDPGGVLREVMIHGRAFFSSGDLDGGDADRKAVRLVGIVRKISDRHFYQRVLAESDHRLRWALQQAPIPIMIHSDDGKVIDLNRAWQRITGYSIEEIPTLDIWATVAWGESDARGMLEQIYQAGDGSSGEAVELTVRTKNGGSRRWAFYSAELGSLRPGQRVRMISALDLTEREAAEEERNSALAQAEAANQSKDQFLATLSHELRTPLNAILGWIFLMKQDSMRWEVQKEGLAIIERNARAQSGLIADLLDISRIVAGKLRLEPRRLDFLTSLQAAMDNVRPSAEEKGVQLVSTTDFSRFPGIAMYGDPVRLEQILLNVLVNAIKFTPSAGTVEVSVETSQTLMRLTVKDTGIGIAPEFFSSLFDRFSQADESVRKDRGLGLGLTISRHLVELHGGRIFALSDGLGKGSSFIVELPIAPTQLEKVPNVDCFQTCKNRQGRH